MGGLGSGNKRRIDWEKVAALRKNSPALSNEAIGKTMGGVSREWVRKILKDAGLPTRAAERVLPCHFCKAVLKRSLLKRTWENGKAVMGCAACCRKRAEERRVILICDNGKCRKRFTRQRSEVRKGKKHFCGQYCKGVVLYRTYRFGKRRKKAA